MNNVIKSYHYGQDLVEFALLIPVMILTVILFTDLGRALFFYSTLTNVSREGARYGVVHLCDDTGIINAAKEKALGINPDDINFTITWNPVPEGYPSDCVPVEFGAATVTVAAESGFEPITEDLLFGSSPFTINITTTMYVESFLP